MFHVGRLGHRTCGRVRVFFKYRVLLKPSVKTLATSTKSNMRLVQFEFEGKKALGVQAKQGDDVVDLSESSSGFPADMKSLIEGGEQFIAKARSAVKSGQTTIAADKVKLLAPITNPDKILCVGNNYRDHCAEQGVPVPTSPVLFNKFPSTIRGPGDPIPYPCETEKLDYEVELAIIIGKKGKNISESDAMDHVFGFTVAHDISARDWQLEKGGGQWIIGKTMDAFCPLGPAIVMKDDVDPHKLGLRTRVNGETKQDSNTDQLVFKTEALVVFLSRFFTLLPGDVILTGTPPGVGVFRRPPVFLKKGDVVEVEIDNIGTLENQVV